MALLTGSTVDLTAEERVALEAGGVPPPLEPGSRVRGMNRVRGFGAAPGHPVRAGNPEGARALTAALAGLPPVAR